MMMVVRRQDRSSEWASGKSKKKAEVAEISADVTLDNTDEKMCFKILSFHQLWQQDEWGRTLVCVCERESGAAMMTA